MLKIQEGLDLIIEHYIDELREARLGERHTIPDRYALTILEDTEAIRNYVKPVLADRIRELDEQVPKTRIEDLTREIEGKEGKTSPVWCTGTPTEEGWYLMKVKLDDEIIYDTNYLTPCVYGMDWRYAHEEIIEWQKIEENEDGRTD